MKTILFLLSDLWMIAACFTFGWRFIRQYGNYLLGIELLVIGTSGTNFLFWSLLSGSTGSPFYHLAYAFDAFSRSFGATLILAVGLLAVTHRYKPGKVFDICIFTLAAVGGILLGGKHDDTLHVGVATFYLVMYVLTTAFVLYFISRVWQIGAKMEALWALLATTVGLIIAVTYDFFPWSFDDADRTWFYITALATWGSQGATYFFAYRKLHEHNLAVHPVETRAMEAHA